MVHVSQNLICSLGFHDSPIQKIELNDRDKSLKIYLAYADIVDRNNSLFAKRTNLLLGKGFLLFQDWNKLLIRRDDFAIDKHEILTGNNYEQFEEILKFEQGEDYVKIGGFGNQTKNWTQWTIVGSQYYGEFDEYEQS